MSYTSILISSKILTIVYFDALASITALISRKPRRSLFRSRPQSTTPPSIESVCSFIHHNDILALPLMVNVHIMHICISFRFRYQEMHYKQDSRRRCITLLFYILIRERNINDFKSIKGIIFWWQIILICQMLVFLKRGMR